MHQIIKDKDVPGRMLVAVFSLLLLVFSWPFILPVFWALVLAILLRPLWRKLEERSSMGPVGRGLLILLGITLVFVIPLVMIILALPGQVNALMEVLPQYQKTFTQLIDRGLAYLPPTIAADIQSALANQGTVGTGQFSKTVLNLLQSAASSTFSLFVNVGVMLYVLFFFLVDGKKIYRAATSYLPFSDELTERLSHRFVTITKASVLGVFVIAVAQGTVAGIIYALLGVQAPVALGVATILVSLIPAVGSGLVWVPVAIFLAVNGQVTKAIILLAAGFFIISMVDNLLRPRLVGRSTQIPDWVIMVTTLGGLALIGGTGIVMGPMIAGITLSLWQMTRPQAEEEFAEKAGDTPSNPRRKPKATT